MAGTMGGTAAVVAKIDGTSEEIIKQQAAGLAYAANRNILALRLLVGWLAAVALAVTAFGSAAGIWVLLGLVLFSVLLSQPMRRRSFAQIYRRMRFPGEAFTVTAEWHILQIVAPTYSATWSWECISEVADYCDGLLLIFHGNCSTVFLSPSAFPDAAAKSRAKELITGWIGAAQARM